MSDRATNKAKVMAEAAQRNELKGTGYELFIGILSVLSIVNLVLIYAFDDPNLDDIILIINGLLSTIFLGDFTYRLFTAESKSRYFFRQYGWADLLSCIPIEQAKIFRVFRVVRVSRGLRASGAKGMGRSLLKDRAESALLTLLLMGILVLEFGSLEILHIEQYQPDANITTASDALWYVIVTISTVGYGDRYPVTDNGRFLGALIIVVGVGIFGTFTGYLANLFLSPKKASKASGSLTETDNAELRMARLKELMAQQQAAVDEMEQLLQADQT